MDRTRTLSLVAATAALGAVTALSTAGGAGAQGTGCTRANNVEAIIDDSGSMSFSDGAKLRVRGMKLFMANNSSKTLGAVEFGSDAARLFAPGRIGTFENQMAAALDQRIQADNLSTDYNAAFTAARLNNPNAQARIFLTDGGHTDGVYQNLHRGGPRTYVVGFGSVTSGEDGNRLRQIAAETKGRPFLQVDNQNLQAVFEEITSALNCQARPKTYTDLFTRAGQSKRHSLVIPRGFRSVRFTLSWLNPTDSFDIGSFRILRRGKVVAKSRVRKLRVRKRRGASFVTVRVSRVTRGRMRFRVRANRITVPGQQVRLTTQATRSRGR